MDTDVNRRLLLQAATLAPILAAASANGAKAGEGNGLVVIAELVSKPDQAGALRDILVPFAAGARKEPGCDHYVLMEDEESPGRFLTYEVWTDKAALAAHMQTPAIKAAAPKLSGILAKPFTQIMLRTLSA